MKRKILLQFIFFLLFIACSEDQLSENKNDDVQGQSEILEDSKDQNIMARAAVSGAVLSMGIDSPLDASGNVLINSTGTTTVNFRVLIVRNSASSDVHLQFKYKAI